MVNPHRKALERMWKDQCTIIQGVKVTDPETKLTGFQESPLLENQPCKLSFETLTSSEGDPVAAVGQTVKIFCSPDVIVPAGCKVIVTRRNQVFTYASSGEPGVFTDHQEIILTLWKGWA